MTVQIEISKRQFNDIINGKYPSIEEYMRICRAIADGTVINEQRKDKRISQKESL